MPTNVELLRSGGAFVDLSTWRKNEVSGSEALSWLNDLVSADIAGIRPGSAIRSLLLSPTGGVRAEFTVTDLDGDLVLIQDPDHSRSILELLDPYVLSSDVRLIDRTEDLGLFAFPGRSEPPEVAGGMVSIPSCVAAGADLIFPAEGHERVTAELKERLSQASLDDLEAWRIDAGLPRVGVDVAPEDLPQEGGLEHAVSFDKGCFLGQEAVARARNLGHPRRVVLAIEADVPVAPGDPVHSDGTVVGAITSAAGVQALAKVRWGARDGPLRTAGGFELRTRS